MSEPRRVVVLGAHGFVGGAVATELERLGHMVDRVSAPRLAPCSASQAEFVSLPEAEHIRLTAAFDKADVIVNAAGDPDASNRDDHALIAANAAMPASVARLIAHEFPTARFIHVSTAAVQGRADVLDDAAADEGFSAYSRSKVLGEQLTLAALPTVVLYRPSSVHDASRRVSRLTAAIARSPFRSVANPASAPSPQSLITNVASAVGYLATCETTPPTIVIHPWEGITTGSLMELLGGRSPHVLPRAVALTLVRVLEFAGRLVPSLSANARRVEMLWFGQRQASSWLTTQGWQPPAGPDAWRALGRRLASDSVND